MVQSWFKSGKYFIKKKLREVYQKSADVYHDFTGSRVHLRPSDIRYTEGVISSVIQDIDGHKETVHDLLRDALHRDKSWQDIANNVTVVYMADRRGYYGDRKSRKDPGNLPGWWAVKGLQSLWVLKALEERNVLKALSFKCVDTISQSTWNAVCGAKLLDKGRTVEGEDKGSLVLEKHHCFLRRRKYLAPEWGKVHMKYDGVRSMSIAEYEDPKIIKNTLNCQGRGICHSPVKHHEVDSDPNTDKDHRCQRLYETILRRKSPSYDSMLNYVMEWRFWVKYVLFALYLAIFMFCYVATREVWIGRQILPYDYIKKQPSTPFRVAAIPIMLILSALVAMREE